MLGSTSEYNRFLPFFDPTKQNNEFKKASYCNIIQGFSTDFGFTLLENKSRERKLSKVRSVEHHSGEEKTLSPFFIVDIITNTKATFFTAHNLGKICIRYPLFTLHCCHYSPSHEICPSHRSQ
ncbi:unnamed protein product [Cylicocyclus nassatus]|uniref:Uncharacterized protein n=1 Tax=Cylicocyclus nassatus TaxID=53992 RepID=A0AA36DKK8_CYLNA|nr:unnamed protein product [Cylicocyclus nassatus]